VAVRLAHRQVARVVADRQAHAGGEERCQGLMGHRLWTKNVDTVGFLQRHTAGEPTTPYQIRSHHFCLKRRGR
jgi:hypothetical protein